MEILKNTYNNLFYIIFLFIILLNVIGCSSSDDSESIFYRLTKKDRVLSVSGEGVFQPVNEVNVMVPMGVYSTIAEIEDEGKQVKKGDILVKFNSSMLDERKKWIESSFDNSRIHLEKKKSDNKYAEKTDKLSLESQKEQLEFFTKKNDLLMSGADTLEVQNNKLGISISERRLELEKMRLEEKEKMFKQGYVSKLELEKSKNNLDISEDMLEKEKTNLELLESRPLEDELKKNDLNLEKTNITLKKLEDDVKTNKIKRNIETKKYERSFKKAKMDLKQIEDKIEKSILKAPIDGMLMHVEGWAGKPRVGTRVWSGMTIVKVADFSKLRIKGTVDEKRIDSIKVGNKVLIKVGALSGLEIKGTVEEIGKIGKLKDDSDKKGVKEFEVKISLDKQMPSIKPNFSVSFEIITQEIKNCISIPYEFAEKVNGKIKVIKKGFSGNKEMNLDIVASDGDYYYVKEGLDEGDELVPIL